MTHETTAARVAFRAATLPAALQRATAWLLLLGDYDEVTEVSVGQDGDSWDVKIQYTIAERWAAQEERWTTQ